MPTDFLAIVGPTASGKTALSLDVAPLIGAEVVSMDSRQVYSGMDIGTAKVEPEGRASVPHHGLDRVHPGEAYGAGRFAREARAWIREIQGRGKVPLLVGGTGFFLRALTDPIFREPPLDPERREALRRWLSRQSPERLASWVGALDPERARVALAGGPQRLGRAIEVALLTGRPLSEWHRSGESEARPLAGPVVLLELPRKEMDRRIDARVDRMVEAGLVEEVRALLDAGYVDADPGMSATGYREVAGYLRGEWTLERAMDEIRRATRKYARRQLTWFRHQLSAGSVAVDATAPLEDQVRRVITIWESALEREDEGG